MPVRKQRFKVTLIHEDPKTQYRSLSLTYSYQNPKVRANSVGSRILTLRGELFDSLLSAA